MSKQGEKLPRGRRGSILITIGIVFVTVAVLLTAYNMWDSYRAGQEADSVVAQLPDGDENALAAWNKDAKMPTKTVNGYKYIGKINIPSVNRNLPVMASWDYTRLTIAPCRYAGSYWADDLVIIGHNYYSHFSPIKWIDPGADVYFTNVKGLKIHYKVSNRETLQPTSVEQAVDNYMNSSSNADWDLTLMTCNTGGQTRCAVRCVRVSGPGR